MLSKLFNRQEYAARILLFSAISSQTQAVIPVREENVAQVRQGEVIQVKYLPGKPGSVIYQQTLKVKVYAHSHSAS